MIDSLFKVRADGKRVDITWTLAHLLALGWEPSKVTRLEWLHQGKAVAFDAPTGVLCQLTAGREYLATLVDAPSPEAEGELLVLNADGSVRWKPSNEPLLEGTSSPGSYQWFEREADAAWPSSFAVMFRRCADMTLFRLVIDASTGALLSCTRSR